MHPKLDREGEVIRRTFQARSVKHGDIQITIDIAVDQIAFGLAGRALRSKRHRASAQDDQIRVYVD